MRTVIKVENLSKKFRIGKLRSDDATLRDLIANIVKYRFANSRKDQNLENLWALKDINFEVREGETFGIIGGNGAGKSTLLKILSRIIKPTEGKAKLKGRVGSLLEIGTGFHQDLTGRENIFLNGAVLGMRHREVEKKFDEIVAFADLEKFLDTPVKFYSTGMYARLAFAVAAHLEPEILIIDEVLAVGDAAFQAKCLGKMGRVAESGRTVIFVSHDAGSVTKLCRTGIYLEKGRIKGFGDMDSVMAQYKADYESMIEAQSLISRNPNDVTDGQCRFVKWKALNSETKISYDVISGEKAVFEFDFVSHRTDNITLKFAIKDINHRIIISATHHLEIERGFYHLRWLCHVPLRADTYIINALAFSRNEQIVLDAWDCEPQLTVLYNQELSSDEIESLVKVPTQLIFERA